MPAMPPHCLPGLAACAPDGIEIITASAAASETKRLVLMIASSVSVQNNQRLCLPSARRDDCEVVHAMTGECHSDAPESGWRRPPITAVLKPFLCAKNA